MELLLVMFMITLFFSVLFLRLESPLSGGDLRLAGRMVVNEISRARLKVQEGEADIRFSANGASDRALIHIRNEENEVLTLTLHPLTGEVEVQEGYVDERES
jgi:hypothetical protein